MNRGGPYAVQALGPPQACASSLPTPATPGVRPEGLRATQLPRRSGSPDNPALRLRPNRKGVFAFQIPDSGQPDSEGISRRAGKTAPVRSHKILSRGLAWANKPCLDP